MILTFVLVLAAACICGANPYPRPFALNAMSQTDFDMPDEYYFPFTEDSRINDTAVRDCAKGRIMTFVGGVVKAGSGFVLLDGTQGGTVQAPTNGFFADPNKRYSIYMSFIAKSNSILLSTGDAEPEIFITMGNSENIIILTNRGHIASVDVNVIPNKWNNMFLSFVAPDSCILNFNGKETSFTLIETNPARKPIPSRLYVGYHSNRASKFQNMVGKIRALGIFSSNANAQASAVIQNTAQWRMRVARFAATGYCAPPTPPDTAVYVPGFTSKFVTGTRAEAHAACQTGEDELATILNKYQNQGAANACHGSKGCWIGLNISSSGDVTWMDGSEVVYNNFGSGEPSPGKNCAVITPTAEWRAESCTNDRATICQVVASNQAVAAALEKAEKGWWNKGWLVASICALVCCVVVMVPCVFLSRNKQGELKPLLPSA